MAARDQSKGAGVTTSVLAAAVLAWIALQGPVTALWAIDDFLQVSGPCGLDFPADHGPHPGYRTEWWYYTGHLTDSEQRRYGFQLTFFRSRLTPPSARDRWPTPASPWRTDQIYLAHAAVTDIGEGRHVQAEKALRPVLAMAGAQAVESGWRVFVDNWRTTIKTGSHRLEADTGSFMLDLNLTPVKPVVLHGNNGYSRKGQAPERASCYYSFTRLKVEGKLSMGQRRTAVTGIAWMDHEFSTAALEPGITGWDWFSLQLSDHTEIMVYLLRLADGRLHTATSGTYVLASGNTQHLGADGIDITPQDFWTSPHSGGRYPVQWQVSIPALQCRLAVKANVPDQEMRTPQSTGVDYWEGSVDITGFKAGNRITGAGYVEMTGYAEPFEAPM